MNFSLANPPQGSPRCWGRQYQPNDKECVNCPFQWSCKETFGRETARAPQQPWTGNTNWQPGWAPPPPPPLMQTQQQTAPMAPAYGYGPPQGFVPVGRITSGPPSQPQQSQQTWPMEDYGAMFGQYPTETTGERLGKNIILRALEAVFSELSRFFHYYKWPKL